MWILAMVFGAVGLLMIGLGVPLSQRWVRPNVLYGLRTRETLENEAVWYEANAYSGRLQIAFGASLLALSCALPFTSSLSLQGQAMVYVTWLVLGTLILAVGSVKEARRLASFQKASI